MEAFFATLGTVGTILFLGAVGLAIYYLVSHHVGLATMESRLHALEGGTAAANSTASKALDTAHAAHVAATEAKATAAASPAAPKA